MAKTVDLGIGDGVTATIVPGEGISKIKKAEIPKDVDGLLIWVINEDGEEASHFWNKEFVGKLRCLGAGHLRLVVSTVCQWEMVLKERTSLTVVS